MPSDLPPYQVIHNIEQRRFEVCVDTHLAFASYFIDSDQVVFDHTYVPPALRGRGLAAVLVQAAMSEARSRGWRIVPHCTYVAAFIEHNPEFGSLVAKRPGT